MDIQTELMKQSAINALRDVFGLSWNEDLGPSEVQITDNMGFPYMWRGFPFQIADLGEEKGSALLLMRKLPVDKDEPEYHAVSSLAELREAATSEILWQHPVWEMRREIHKLMHELWPYIPWDESAWEDGWQYPVFPGPHVNTESMTIRTGSSAEWFFNRGVLHVRMDGWHFHVGRPVTTQANLKYYLYASYGPPPQEERDGVIAPNDF